MNVYERELFIRLCKTEDIDKERISDLTERGFANHKVLGALFFNRMAGCADYVLTECGVPEGLNREFYRSIHNARQQNILRNREFFQCIRALVGTLDGLEEKYVFLKGAYLCSLYPEGCRTSNDVDILTDGKNVSEIGKRLKDAGFEQGYLKNGIFRRATREEVINARIMNGETVPYVIKVGLPMMDYFEVDINFSTDFRASDGNITREILRKAGTKTVNGTAIPLPDRYDFILHLCAHLYKEISTMPWIRMKRDMTLYKFADINLMTRSLTDQDRFNLLCRSSELGLEEIYRRVTGMTSEIFNPGTRDKNYPGDFPVTDPATAETYRYTDRSALRRFFCENREGLLKREEKE